VKILRDFDNDFLCGGDWLCSAFITEGMPPGPHQHVQQAYMQEHGRNSMPPGFAPDHQDTDPRSSIGVKILRDFDNDFICGGDWLCSAFITESSPSTCAAGIYAGTWKKFYASRVRT
jgi:iron-sulfur cluster repair protein YtfE (RIC family)